MRKDIIKREVDSTCASGYIWSPLLEETHSLDVESRCHHDHYLDATRNVLEVLDTDLELEPKYVS